MQKGDHNSLEERCRRGLYGGAGGFAYDCYRRGYFAEKQKAERRQLALEVGDKEIFDAKCDHEELVALRAQTTELKSSLLELVAAVHMQSASSFLFDPNMPAELILENAMKHAENLIGFWPMEAT